MSLSNMVFKTDPAGSPGQVTFDVINRAILTPATVAVTVTYQNPDGSVISVVLLHCRLNNLIAEALKACLVCSYP